MTEGTLTLAAAIDILQEIHERKAGKVCHLVVQRFSPGGQAADQSTEVVSIEAGIDWENGLVIIRPVKPLTELTPDEVAAVLKSVRAGGSWHVYQRVSGLLDRIRDLEAEVADLRRAAPHTS